MQNIGVIGFCVDQNRVNSFQNKPGSKGEDCADLSTSMKFGIHVDQNSLNSFIGGRLCRFVYKHEIWHTCRPEQSKFIY